uniref:Uncharacterized protein n=1 Tax=Marseillevirus LCMAC101 TaxID=2506602 RepID=A0A481YTD4_9VIRU|nr:MAG: hypothetical protein LCMAC101_03610 [Marseillevirus LCMAC101]
MKLSAIGAINPLENSSASVMTAEILCIIRNVSVTASWLTERLYTFAGIVMAMIDWLKNISRDYSLEII